MTDQLAVYDETARDMAAPVVGAQFVNTCDLSTRAGKIASAKAVTGALSLNDVPAGTVINVRDIITMPGVRKARDPRLPNVPCINTYIIDTGGQAYMSQSEGIAQSAALLTATFPDMGKSDPEGCVPVYVQVTPLDGGKTYKTLVPTE